MSRQKRQQHPSDAFEQASGQSATAVRSPPATNSLERRKRRPKGNGKASETYALRLTPQQRKSLIHCTRLRNKLKERLKDAGDGTQVLCVTRKELGHLNEELGEASLYSPGPDKKRLVAVLHRVADLIAQTNAEPLEREAPRTLRTAPKTGERIYQFKIMLLDIEPAIWRRLQVPDGTLADLHTDIQAAFGWWNYHLHQFAIDGEWYGPPAPDGMNFDLETRDENGVLLSQLIPRSGRKPRWLYEYDLGDGWRHEIIFERYVPGDPKAKYPRCVGGARACPPEDCGGPWGYADYLATLANPRHKRHAELLEWRGPFDPEAFDANKATREMRKVQ